MTTTRFQDILHSYCNPNSMVLTWKQALGPNKSQKWIHKPTPTYLWQRFLKHSLEKKTMALISGAGKTLSICRRLHLPAPVTFYRNQNGSEMKITSRGRCCRALVKLPLGTPISHDGVPGTASCLLFPSSFLLTITLGGSRWWLRYLVPCHVQGRPGLNSWLWPGRCLAIAGI